MSFKNSSATELLPHAFPFSSEGPCGDPPPPLVSPSARRPSHNAACEDKFNRHGLFRLFCPQARYSASSASVLVHFLNAWQPFLSAEGNCNRCLGPRAFVCVYLTSQIWLSNSSFHTVWENREVTLGSNCNYQFLWKLVNCNINCNRVTSLGWATVALLLFFR